MPASPYAYTSATANLAGPSVVPYGGTAPRASAAGSAYSNTARAMGTSALNTPPPNPYGGSVAGLQPDYAPGTQRDATYRDASAFMTTQDPNKDPAVKGADPLEGIDPQTGMPFFSTLSGKAGGPAAAYLN